MYRILTLTATIAILMGGWVRCSKTPTQNLSTKIETLTTSDHLISLYNGASHQFSLSARFSDGRVSDVTDEAYWKTSPGRAGKISPTGLFQADSLATGIETVTASFQGLQLQLSVAITPENMIYVPPGPFTMGSNQGAEDAVPEHEVYLDGYFIDKYEVTNKQFAQFLNEEFFAGKISLETGTAAKNDHPLIDLTDAHIIFDGSRFKVIEGKENYPAIEVTWFGAKAYADHYGKRLPSEAEWEKAARGTDKRIFPWGNAEPSASLCNYNNQIGTTTPIGSFSPAGDSFYGLSDMAGNVAEWCSDWYDANYYKSKVNHNPEGPSSGNYRSVRGGAFFLSTNLIRSIHRSKDRPDHLCSPYGFRCAKDL